MPANSTHPEYDFSLPNWSRARDVLAGEDTVKRRGELYLPRLNIQTDDEYQHYKTRASFFNATARTAEGFSGLIFRRDPSLKFPDTGRLGQAMTLLRNDLDMLGTPILAYAKKLVVEILAVGRAGTVIDWEDQERRPYLSLYRAEDILNWKTERIDGRNRLSMVVLAETSDVSAADPYELREEKQIRVLRLEGETRADRHCLVEIWREIKDDRGQTRWNLLETLRPTRRGRPLPAIPFVFHGPLHSLPDVSKIPLEDILVVNLDHYRLNADYKHGIHYTALPTAWVAGFDVDSASPLKIGASTAWVSKNVGATAGYLEFTGQGLATFERAMQQDERLMALLGSRLLESQKRAAETAEALSIRQNGEVSVLMNIASSISESFTQALRWACWWHTADRLPEDIHPDKIFCRLNTDYESSAMTAQELTALVQAWQAGAISRESMFDLMRQGEVLPPGRSNHEESTLISQSL